MSEKNEILFNSSLRTDYSNSTIAFIDRTSAGTEKLRDKFLYLEEQPKREELKKLLGFPLFEDEWTAKFIKKEVLDKNQTYIATRYSFDINGIIFGGILYEHPNDVGNNNCAMVFALHGGGGTSEIVGDLFIDSDNYNHMVKRLLKPNLKVFAPQLLLWDINIYGSNFDRDFIHRRLVQLGGSKTAYELKLLSTVLTYWQDYCDKNRMGVLGLSYGGMYALHLGALDTRLKCVFSSCWFNDRTKHCWSDWIYLNAEKTMLDTEVASLVIPRKLYIEVAVNDEMFKAKDAENEINRLLNYANKNGFQNCLKIKIFDGVHELDKDNAMLEEFKKYI